MLQTNRRDWSHCPRPNWWFFQTSLQIHWARKRPKCPVQRWTPSVQTCPSFCNGDQVSPTHACWDGCRCTPNQAERLYKRQLLILHQLPNWNKDLSIRTATNVVVFRRDIHILRTSKGKYVVGIVCSVHGWALVGRYCVSIEQHIIILMDVRTFEWL